GIVGKLILQGLEILWLKWKSAYQASEVIDAILAQSHDTFTDHTAALGGLACLIRGACQDGAVAIRRWPCGHGVRVRVTHCHNKNPQALFRAARARYLPWPPPLCRRRWCHHCSVPAHRSVASLARRGPRLRGVRQWSSRRPGQDASAHA